MLYGFQRLVLLGSAGYSRAELPLDGAVSLVAPNNTQASRCMSALRPGKAAMGATDRLCREVA